MEHKDFLDPEDKLVIHLLNYAPDPVIVQILLNIHPDKLKVFCSLNKKVRKICKSITVKEEYHQKWFYEPKTLADAQSFLKMNPNGLLSIKIDSKFTNKDLLEVGENIIYLEQKHDSFNMDVFRGLKNLKTWKIFYKGKLNKEATYKDGILDGIYRFWHGNGQLYKESTYKNGKINGLYRKWGSDGQLQVEATYKNGNRKGLYRKWKNGKLKEKMY